MELFPNNCAFSNKLINETGCTLLQFLSISYRCSLYSTQWCSNWQSHSHVYVHPPWFQLGVLMPVRLSWKWLSLGIARLSGRNADLRYEAAKTYLSAKHIDTVQCTPRRLPLLLWLLRWEIKWNKTQWQQFKFLLCVCIYNADVPYQFQFVPWKNLSIKKI